MASLRVVVRAVVGSSFGRRSHDGPERGSIGPDGYYYFPNSQAPRVIALPRPLKPFGPSSRA
jgi:hypothetical protein